MLANASRYPLLRRADQHFQLQSKLENYSDEISRISIKNKSALASVDSLERRISEMQMSLHCRDLSSSSTTVSVDADRTNDVGGHMATKQTRGRDELEDHQSGNAISSNATISSSADTVSDKTNHQIITAPTAPTNVRITEVGHDYFIVEWDKYHDQTIVDYEIRYSHSTAGAGDEKQVQSQQISCSRWCLTQPIPERRYKVENLQPATQYRDIAIRRRNCVGWSEWSGQMIIAELTTAPLDEDRAKRRRQFIFRIQHLEQSIQKLELAKQKIPKEQVLLARNMSRLQDRIDELECEIERVISHDGKAFINFSLHGSDQTFLKAALKHKLEQERATCRENIAHWRAGIIDLDKETGEVAAEISEKQTRIGERKAALLNFDKQQALVTRMKRVVSKSVTDLKSYYIARWRSNVQQQLEMKRIIESVARSCRGRIYAAAFRKLCSLVSGRREAEHKRKDVDADGVGGLLLNVAKCNVEETLSDAAHLIGVVSDIKQNQDDGDRGMLVQPNKCPTHLLRKEDKDLLVKGDFLFNAKHYASSLECYQQVLSKIESPDYFVNGVSSTDAIVLYAEVNGKIGHVQHKLRSFDLAIVYFGRQLSLAEEEDLNIPIPRIEALLGLGMCYTDKCDYVYAEALLHRAKALCLAAGDRANEIIASKHLQTCYKCMNLHDDASALEAKIQSIELERESTDTAISRRVVDHAKELGKLRIRLIDGLASQAQVVQLEVASAHRVHLLQMKSAKEEQLRSATGELSASRQLAKELNELIEQIQTETQVAKTTKKNRFISSLLVKGSNQNVKTTELVLRLEAELKVVRSKLDDCLAGIPRTEMFIHNTTDDINVLQEELIIEEGPLMKQIIKGRKYRCISLNAKNGVDCIALSEGSNCYVHNLTSGKLHHVFTSNNGEEGSASTIMSLFFYGNHVYAGTMNSEMFGWDISSSSSFEPTFVAKGHEAAITCIHGDDSKIVTGSADKSIIVWNKEGTLLRRVSGHDKGVHTIQCGLNFCVSSSYNIVYVWDVVMDERTDNIREVRIFLPVLTFCFNICHGSSHTFVICCYTIVQLPTSAGLARGQYHHNPVWRARSGHGGQSWVHQCVVGRVR